MSGNYAIPLYSNRRLSASAAFLIHAAFLLLGGAIFSQSAQYGIEQGFGGMEVNLTAAPAFIEAPAAVEPVVEDTVVVDKSSEAEPLPVPQQVVPEVKGDGSSEVPGKDAATLHSMGGAETLAQPNYLKNPAPRYPLEAKNAGQEGLVLLLARVSPSGAADSVTIKSGSGFSLLDESALKAVQRWKFKPAKIGSMAIESQVEIPIRFQLDKKGI